METFLAVWAWFYLICGGGVALGALGLIRSSRSAETAIYSAVLMVVGILMVVDAAQGLLR